MAYAHCHNCGWEQDDWWTESYPPLDYERLKKLNDMLMAAVQDPEERMINPLDRPFLEEYFGTSHEVDVRKYVAHHLNRMACRISEMHWLTAVDFRADPQCPKCGSQKHMDVD